MLADIAKLIQMVDLEDDGDDCREMKAKSVV